MNRTVKGFVAAGILAFSGTLAAQQGETFITLILVTLAMDVRKPIIVLLKTICSIKGLLNIDHETDLQLPEFN